jgi:hypothetical protein
MLILVDRIGLKGVFCFELGHKLNNLCLIVIIFIPLWLE